MNQEQLLKGLISGKELMMGSTPEGADWCIKALHPSDPTTRVVGIPDMTTATTCLVNYQVTYTLSPQVGATGTWSWEATLLPHPINFMAIQQHDSVGDLNSCVLNTQITGTDISAKTAWLCANAQQWRLAYAGVTITQDGPALADQGTIVASQGPVIPYRFSAAAINHVGPPQSIVATAPVEVYTAEDMPNYMASQALPNSYFDQSKKGVYVPLKLTKTCQQWKSQADLVGCGPAARMTADGAYDFPTGVANYAWPHWDLEATWFDSTWMPQFEAHPFQTSAMLNDVMAHICARNCAVTTSFAFFFRFGIELRVHPTSTLAPQLTLAPRYDMRALETYFAVSRELKDAYEAKFNDMGKLWGVISGTMRDLAPVLNQFGPVGKLVSTVGTGVANVGDQVRSMRQKRKTKVVRKTERLPPRPPPKPSKLEVKRILGS